MRWIEDNRYDPRYGFWSRANVGEVLPDPPSPAGWDLVFEGGTILGWRDCMVNRLGIDESEVDPVRPEVMGLFGGYAYLGITLLRVWAERTPGFSADLLDAAYFAGHPDIPSYVAEPWHRNDRTSEVMAGWLGWVLGDRDQSELEAERREARAVRDDRPELTALTEPELLERARSLKPLCRRLFDQHINQSGAASIGPGILGRICATIGRPAAAMRLLAGLGDVDSAAPSYALWDLSRRVRGSAALTAAFAGGVEGLSARLRADGGAEAGAFGDALEEFLREYGSRGPNEWDIHAPSWEVAPDLVLALVDRMRHADDEASPVVHQATAEAERARLAAEVDGALAGDADVQAQFRAALASAATFVPGRERSKTSIIRVINEIRLAVWELGRRAVARGEMREPADACLLFGDELEALASGQLRGVREVVEARRAHLAWLGSLEPPFLFDQSPPPNTEWPRRGERQVRAAAVGEVLGGLAGCAGTARGRARVVLHPGDPTALEPGDVLVAPMTDPAWTPLFVPAAAVVVDVGAPLSHAIIVSRELSIPCVVSVTDATRRIPDGALVEVDGDAGTVTVVALPER